MKLGEPPPIREEKRRKKNKSSSDSLQETVVKAIGGERRDGGMHAVLRVQHHLGVSPTLQPLKQALAIVGILRLAREYRGRELCRITHQDNGPAVAR